MVMSQGAIDALMAKNAEQADDQQKGDEELTDQLDDVVAKVEEEEATGTAQPESTEEIDPLAGTLSAQELAKVQQIAKAPPPPANALAQKLDDDSGSDGTPGLRPRKWSASAGVDTDLKHRVQELEDKMSTMEAKGPSSGAGDHQLDEMRSALNEISETVQGMMAALRQLTEQSKGSLGFAAKQTFDCPECHSHGTISVPISCTACGFESEWGFYPDEKK